MGSNNINAQKMELDWQNRELMKAPIMDGTHVPRVSLREVPSI